MAACCQPPSGRQPEFQPGHVWNGIATASAFYFGLRGGRSIYSNFLKIAPADYENLRGDAQLSVAIEAPVEHSLGPDTAYLVDQNYLKGVVGIGETDADLAA